jgi:hypothetical protein
MESASTMKSASAMTTPAITRHGAGESEKQSTHHEKHPEYLSHFILLPRESDCFAPGRVASARERDDSAAERGAMRLLLVIPFT